MTHDARRPLLIVALASLLVWPALVLAQAHRVGVVTLVEGNVTAHRVPPADPVRLKVNDSIFLQDTIVAHSLSKVDMLLGGKVEVSMRERSLLTITNAVPGGSSIDLPSGQISLNVPEDRMRRGEEIDVRTPNAVAVVRGGRVVVEVFREGGVPGGGVTIIYVDVLAGETSVTTAASAPIQVHATEGVTITGGAVGPIRPLRPLPTK